MEDIQIITVCIVEMGYFAEYVENTIMIDGDTNHEPLLLQLNSTILSITHGRCGSDSPLGDVTISRDGQSGSTKLILYRDSEPRFNLADPESLNKLDNILKTCIMPYHRPSLCSACLAARARRCFSR
jgi:hypothetical protein